MDHGFSPSREGSVGPEKEKEVSFRVRTGTHGHPDPVGIRGPLAYDKKFYGSRR